MINYRKKTNNKSPVLEQTIKSKKHIEIVAVENTGMNETGFGSLDTCEGFLEILKTRHETVIFNEVHSEKCLNAIIKRKPDAVVLCMNHIHDKQQKDKIWLSEFFSRNNIPFTGSQHQALLHDVDKVSAKNAVIEAGISTPKFFVADPDSITSEAYMPFPFPVFVKPLGTANGNGIDENSFVHNFVSFRKKVADLHDKYNSSSLVEEVLPGREYTVAILENSKTGRLTISPIEIVVPVNLRGDRMLGQTEKADNCEALYRVPEPIFSEISTFAEKVFRALGARDFARIDIRLDSLGTPNFLEANLSPGMTPKTSYFPRALEISAGMTYKEVLLQMIDAAFKRNEPVMRPNTHHQERLLRGVV